MIILSLDELKLLAENKGIKDYENKSEDDLPLLAQFFLFV